jgi:hypothetical protein
MKGVSASVMFGTLANVGTGVVDIQDSERMPVNKRTPINIPLKPPQKKSKTEIKPKKEIKTEIKSVKSITKSLSTNKIKTTSKKSK